MLQPGWFFKMGERQFCRTPASVCTDTPVNLGDLVFAHPVSHRSCKKAFLNGIKGSKQKLCARGDAFGQVTLAIAEGALAPGLIYQVGLRDVPGIKRNLVVASFCQPSLVVGGRTRMTMKIGIHTLSEF